MNTHRRIESPGDPDDDGLISRSTAKWIIVVASAGFLINLTASVLSDKLHLGYTPSEAINAIFGAVVTSALVLRSKSKE